MGILTRPKLILPFQIARIAERIRNRGSDRAALGRQRCFRRRRRSIGALKAFCTGIGRRTLAGGGVQLLDADAAQLKEPDQRFFDQVVRAGRAGRDADDDRASGSQSCATTSRRSCRL